MRKIVSIIPFGNGWRIVALCDDGTTWQLWDRPVEHGGSLWEWLKLPEIPQ